MDDEPSGLDDWPDDLAIAGARLHLREGDAHAAERLLNRWTANTPAATLSARLAAGLLSALAAQGLGQTRQATQRLEQVLTIADADGFRRPFRYGGPEVRKLLLAQLDAGTTQGARISDLLGRGAASDAARVRAQALVAPLTDREVTILRYLQGTLSNVEIAAQLSVSVNTVKTHISSIYRKLAVARRRHAVRKARELDLL
jgi:LuxR family maltose regulon positive regulatory protein